MMPQFASMLKQYQTLNPSNDLNPMRKLFVQAAAADAVKNVGRATGGFCAWAMGI
jgi:hypothetical protein